MSTVDIALRLSGHLPPLEELNHHLGTPTWAARQGEQVSRRIQPVDVWLLDLAQYDSDRPASEIDQQWLQVAAVMTKLAPAIATLDRTQCHADLYISTTRDEDQGGLSLPPELISAAAAANLSLQISILVLLDNDEESELLLNVTSEPAHAAVTVTP